MKIHSTRIPCSKIVNGLSVAGKKKTASGFVSGNFFFFFWYLHGVVSWTSSGLGSCFLVYTMKKQWKFEKYSGFFRSVNEPNFPCKICDLIKIDNEIVTVTPQTRLILWILWNWEKEQCFSKQFLWIWKCNRFWWKASELDYFSGEESSWVFHLVLVSRMQGIATNQRHFCSLGDLEDLTMSVSSPTSSHLFFFSKLFRE